MHVPRDTASPAMGGSKLPQNDTPKKKKKTHTYTHTLTHSRLILNSGSVEPLINSSDTSSNMKTFSKLELKINQRACCSTTQCEI